LHRLLPWLPSLYLHLSLQSQKSNELCQQS
jgi:hypothetical protein